MLFQRFPKNVTKSVIIIQAANFGYHSESFKRFIVQFIDKGQVRVGDDHIGKLLDISQAMCQSLPFESVHVHILFFGHSVQGHTESAALFAHNWQS